MADLDSGIDLECGGLKTGANHHLRHSTSDDTQYFSDGEDGGSCYTQFYSTFGDDDRETGRVSSARSDCSVEIGVGDDGKVVVVVAGDCRICHLSLADDGGDGDSDAIELGCCCKDDLAVAHKHCAETWFKIKGNKICEICNSIVSNLIIQNETPMVHVTINTNSTTTSVASAHMSTTTTQRRRCINGHRLLNFVLACLVFAFVISWLFHFNIPS